MRKIVLKNSKRVLKKGLRLNSLPMLPRIIRKAALKSRLWLHDHRLRKIYAKGEFYATDGERARMARASSAILRKYSDLLEPTDRMSLEAVRDIYSKKKPKGK